MMHELAALETVLHCERIISLNEDLISPHNTTGPNSASWCNMLNRMTRPLCVVSRERQRCRRRNGPIGRTSMFYDDGMAARGFLGIFMLLSSTVLSPCSGPPYKTVLSAQSTLKQAN